MPRIATDRKIVNTKTRWRSRNNKRKEEIARIQVKNVKGIDRMEGRKG
jgi:hypothetical protein